MSLTPRRFEHPRLLITYPEHSPVYARVQHQVEMRAHTLPVLEVLQIWPLTLIRRMGGQGAEGFESEGFENVPQAGFEINWMKVGKVLTTF